MKAAMRRTPDGPPAPVTVRVVRGVWWEGRGLAPGEVVTLSRSDAGMLAAAGKVVRTDSPPAAPPPDAETPAVRHREPVRRMRR